MIVFVAFSAVRQLGERGLSEEQMIDEVGLLQEVCGLYRVMRDTSADDMRTRLRTGVYKSTMPTNAGEFGQWLAQEWAKRRDQDDVKLRVEVREIKKANLQHLMALKRNLVATEITFDVTAERAKLAADGKAGSAGKDKDNNTITGLQVRSPRVRAPFC
jgi:hypothetical protein